MMKADISAKTGTSFCPKPLHISKKMEEKSLSTLKASDKTKVEKTFTKFWNASQMCRSSALKIRFLSYMIAEP